MIVSRVEKISTSSTVPVVSADEIADTEAAEGEWDEKKIAKSIKNNQSKIRRGNAKTKMAAAATLAAEENEAADNQEEVHDQGSNFVAPRSPRNDDIYAEIDEHQKKVILFYLFFPKYLEQ